MDASEYVKCHTQLGKGSLSAVSLYYRKSTHEPCAVKKTGLNTSLSHRCAHAEVRAYQVLPPHRNLTRFHDARVAKESMYLTLEYLPSDLRRVINESKRSGIPIPEPYVRAYIHDVLSGLSHLHEHNIIHRDIKPSNVLLGAQPVVDPAARTAWSGVAKLSDLGLSVAYTEGMVIPQLANEGTPGYRPPETLLGLTRVLSVHHLDMWCCGCLIAELLSQGELPFDRSTGFCTLHSIFRVLGRPTVHTWPDLSNLTLYPQALLSFDSLPIEVPSLRDVLTRNVRATSAMSTGSSSSGGGKRSNNNNSGSTQPIYHDSLFDLLSCMLRLDPLQRITARAALSHTLFAERHVPRLPVPLPISTVWRTLVEWRGTNSDGNSKGSVEEEEEKNTGKHSDAFLCWDTLQGWYDGPTQATNPYNSASSKPLTSQVGVHPHENPDGAVMSLPVVPKPWEKGKADASRLGSGATADAVVGGRMVDGGVAWAQPRVSLFTPPHDWAGDEPRPAMGLVTPTASLETPPRRLFDS